MKKSTKILMSILACGLIYSFYRAFTGEGGSGLGDFYDALVYSSVVLFLVALTILLANIKNYKNHWDTLIFLLIGLPLTISEVQWIIELSHYNRTPDLSVKYKLPIDREQYLFDSTKIKLAIDSYISLRNDKYGGPDILYGVIDTIIYSQKGDKIFVSFINKYEPHDFDQGESFYPDSFVSDKRDSVFWQLTEPRYSMGGSYGDIKILKKEIRKFYFNRFSFVDKDSIAENYFWKIVF